MKIIISFLKVALACLAAEAVLRSLNVPAYILPPPSSIILQLFKRYDYFAANAAITGLEAGLGVSVGLILGVGIAVVSNRWVGLKTFLSPTMTAFQAMPILAFAPLVSTWFGPGIFSKSVLSLLVCLPAIAITIADGLERAPLSETELFRMMNASRWQILWHLRIPRARPYFLIAAKLAVPLAMLGAIVGEFVGASSGLGFIIMRSSYYVRTDEMFAALLVAAMTSIVAVRLLAALVKVDPGLEVRYAAAN